MGKVAPCKDCFIHTITCHFTCSKYDEWKEERKAENEEKYKQNELNYHPWWKRKGKR